MNINISWQSKEIPDKQYEIVKKELTDLRTGSPHEIWKTAISFLQTFEDDISLLDVGCASGYFYEIFSTLLPNKFHYLGVDYSEPMIKKAKENYPNADFEIADVRKMSFADKSFDVVFSCACLEHIKDEWKDGLKELCRVSNKYVVLHKTPLIKGKTTYSEKEIYGKNRVVFNKFNKDEFFSIVHKCGFKNIEDIKTHSRASEYRLVAFERI